MKFTLEDQHADLKRIADQVARELAPGYVERELAAEFSWEAYRRLADAGLLGLNVSEEAGGQGAGELATALACESIGRADFTLATSIIGAGTAGKLLYRLGSERVKQEWLPKVFSGEALFGLAMTEPGAGSDVRAIRTSARQVDGGWVLRGEKSSMSYPMAQVAFVLANTPDGAAMFVVPADTEGYSVAPFHDMGANQTARGIVTLDDAFVPDDQMLGEPGEGTRAALYSLTSSKVLVGAVCLGVASAAIDDAIEWAKTRTTFGAPLATRQGVTFPLVGLLGEIEAARLLAHKALWLADRGEEFKREAAYAKAMIPNLATRACHQSLMTIGHVGYSNEHPAQQRLRDVIGTELGEGAENIQNMLLSRDIFGVRPS